MLSACIDDIIGQYGGFSYAIYRVCFEPTLQDRHTIAPRNSFVFQNDSEIPCVWLNQFQMTYNALELPEK